MCSQRTNWTRDLEFPSQFSWSRPVLSDGISARLGRRAVSAHVTRVITCFVARDPFTQILVFAILGLFSFQAIELGIFHTNEPHSFALRAYVCEQFKHYANKADDYIYI